ncbi:MAG: hypothetical protein ACJATI_004396 [Halioglobus sp.]|jgi:hypothetical protein
MSLASISYDYPNISSKVLYNHNTSSSGKIGLRRKLDVFIMSLLQNFNFLILRNNGVEPIALEMTPIQGFEFFDLKF